MGLTILSDTGVFGCCEGGVLQHLTNNRQIGRENGSFVALHVRWITNKFVSSKFFLAHHAPPRISA